MASERQIKGRIKSAKNISQITKAMQMVAASKMKRAQAAALAGRPYAEKIGEMVTTLVQRVDPRAHPLLQRNASGKTVIVLISTNKGLLGGLNANLFRHLIHDFDKKILDRATFITLGNKGEQLVVRLGKQLLADFSELEPFSKNIPAITKLIADGYMSGEFKEVFVVYSNFISALKQEPTVKKLLPIAEFTTGLTVSTNPTELQFLIEPSMDAILDPLLVSFLENQIRDAVFEAEASEHSARMIAMKNATDNASEFVSLLTLEYNKARQAKITYEIADMITARAAFE